MSKNKTSKITQLARRSRRFGDERDNMANPPCTMPRREMKPVCNGEGGHTLVPRTA